MSDITAQAVIYFDSLSRPHPALVTQDWCKDCTPKGAINLVYVIPNPDQQDQYGLQLMRQTSVAYIKSHTSYESIMGNCWCTVEEYEKEYKNKIPQRPQ